MRIVAAVLGSLVLSGLFSSAAWAVQCSEVWPVGDGLNENVPKLEIPDFTASESLVADNPRVVPVGDSYWLEGRSATNWVLNAPATGTARVYVKGDLYINNNARINANGSASNLVLIVVGNLRIENSANTRLNALVYATGDVVIGNNPTIEGGVSAAGSLSRGNNINYDPGAIAGTDFGSLCENPDSVGQIDHFRIEHSASSPSCLPMDVILKACATANCDRLYEGSVSAVLSPSTWVGGNVVNFNGGLAALKLRGTGPVTIGLTATPAANNARKCWIGGSQSNCTANFTDSGSLVVEAPDLIAARPETLRVVPSDQNCVPAFANLTRQVQFWGTPQTVVGTTTISSNPASPSVLTLSFDSTGKASLPIRHDDAGSMFLGARYVGSAATGDPGLTMEGSTVFSSRPYGLHISTPADCDSASVADCRVLRMAGDSFPVSIRAVAWQSDGEELTEAALRNNPTTPGFQLSGITLSASLVEPSTASGGVVGTFYQHAADGARQAALTSYNHEQGASTTLQVSQSDVGIYRITATPLPGAYFGHTVSGGTSALIGRFTPAWLGVTANASLTPACGGLSYQGQVIGFDGGQPGVTITGYNRQGEPTHNYDRGDFWRLAAPQRQPYSLIDAASKPNLDARLQSLGNEQSLSVADSGAADGSRTFDWRADAATARLSDALYWQLPALPTVEDLPFGIGGMDIARMTLQAAQVTDLDGVCYRGASGTEASCQDFQHDFGGSEVRLGRLRIDNAGGPENQTLDLPYWLESWQGTASSPFFAATPADGCSLPPPGTVTLDPASFTGDLKASDFPAPPGTLEAAPAISPMPSGVIRLAAPNQSGSVRVSLSDFSVSRPWLQYDWNGDGTPEAPSALATFGMMSGNRAVIFRREIYR